MRLHFLQPCIAFDSPTVHSLSTKALSLTLARMLSLFAATPAFHLSAPAAVPALRTPAPAMQLAGPMAGPAPVASTRVGARPPAPVEADNTVLVQGGSLRTWSYRSPSVEQVQVVLSTEGRPLDADIELWHGPDNTPVKMRVYVEDGQLRPFSAVVETPRGPNTVAIRNIGQVEFPLAANVVADAVDQPSVECLESSMTIQGGALRTTVRPERREREVSSAPTAARSTRASSCSRARTTTSRSSSCTRRTAPTARSSASSRPRALATLSALSTPHPSSSR